MDIQKLNTELRYKATRSSGNGGQNVNKVSTKVELLFDVPASKHLESDEKQTILRKLKHLINQKGVLRIVCQETRSQHENKLIATQKFKAAIDSAFFEHKVRKAVKVPKSVIAKRKENKRKQSAKKINRRKVNLSKISLFFISLSEIF